MKLPKYRRHSNRDYAFVEYRGRRQRLPGRYDSPESREAYHKFIGELLEKRASPVLPLGPGATVAELVCVYLDHARLYYRGDGQPITEYDHLRYACTPLVRLHGDTLIRDFGPMALKEVRRAMVEGSWIRQGEKFKPWSRGQANHQTQRIRRVFRWGVEHELVPAEVSHALGAVAPLRKGRSAARETEPVRPVDWEHVKAVIDCVSPVVAAMIRLQWTTGMRSDNLCLIRPADLDQSEDVWLYRPGRHKTAYRGDPLLIPLGPQAQRLLEPFLDRPSEAYCFSPAESEAWRNARRTRKTATTPSQRARKPKANPKRPKRPHYTPRSYRRAIWYGLQQANKTSDVPHWHPHQLRHTRATLIRQRYGLEASQVYLGHARADVTQIYAERDLRLALQIAREIG